MPGMTAPRVSATGRRRPGSGIAVDPGRLARLRAEKSWDRAALARASGLSPSMIVMIERGERRPRPATLAALCRALGCAPADLLAFKEGG